MPAQSTILCGIYTITNTTNGKVYVGSALHIQRRWMDHRSKLRRGKHSNPYLQAAWNKHGEESFSFAVVELVVEPSLIEREQHWLDTTRCYDRSCGYNISPSAYSIAGYHYTDEQRARMSVALTGKPKSDAHRANIWANRTVTDAFRAQMSRNGKMGKGRRFSPEHVAKKAAAQTGEKNHRAKLTDAQVAEIRRRLCDGERGRKLAAEYGVHEATISEIKHGKKRITARST